MRLDRIINFAAMHRYVLGCFDSQANLVAADLDHCESDLIVDDDAFVLLSRENQHLRSSVGRIRPLIR